LTLLESKNLYRILLLTMLSPTKWNKLTDSFWEITRLNKVVESINVTINETGGRELKEEENESMDQLYEEEGEG
jgi:hypothetical protein